MENQHIKTEIITYLMFGITIVSVLLVGGFVRGTTYIICENYEAHTFLKSVTAIPWNPEYILQWIVFGVLILIVSFGIREFILVENNRALYITLCIDMVIGLIIVYLLDFNYNGVILWIFANIIGHTKRGRIQYALIFGAIGCYAATDYGLISINRRAFSVKDYIRFYDSSMQSYFMATYNILVSLSIIIFILYCVFTIQKERGNLEEINELYQQLSKANEDLKTANIELEKYAVMKEKMGETKERNRLAREIHDTLGHTLTGIATGLEACIATIDCAPDISKKQLKLLSDVTREGLNEVRRSVNELRPDALERFSLEKAIGKLVDRTNSMSDVQVEFICMTPILKFDEDEENAIYRVVQEGITNAIRHGKASYIKILIRREEANIHLTIQDNGCGCEEIKPGFGTRHIAERIQLLKGTVRFDGKNGFLVDAMIPIRWGETYD